VERFAGDVRVLTQACPGLVEQIEEGDLEGPATRSLLESYLAPLLAEGIDSLVLGCTHYPFARAAIEAIAGPDVCVVDPSPAVARQVERVVAERRLLGKGPSGVEYWTSGEPERLRCALAALLGEGPPVARAAWVGGRLVAEPR
jgi:glutamate racemase